jgi:hypothetical protein
MEDILDRLKKYSVYQETALFHDSETYRKLDALLKDATAEITKLRVDVEKAQRTPQTHGEFLWWDR